MIEIKGLSVSYGEKEILHGVDLAFPKGKVSVILGPNGCGKSTLLKALLTMIPKNSGEILLDGEPVESISPNTRAKRIAYLPQSRNMPDISVNRMVLHGRFPYLSYPRHYRPEDRKKAMEALSWVGMEDYSRRPMRSLSGGQRQKVYLAMALAQDTDIILMDEPTTFLDIRNQLEVMALSRRLSAEGKTVIMVLHDLEEALRYSDYTVLMKDGEVAAEGIPGDVIGSDAITSAFGVIPHLFETETGLHCYVEPAEI